MRMYSKTVDDVLAIAQTLLDLLWRTVAVVNLDQWRRWLLNRMLEGVLGSNHSTPTLQRRLKQLYRRHLLPLERRYLFHEFHWPELDEAHFDSKPMVLVLGQYSTGKTSFVRYLLGRNDLPELVVGPEPTTDKFTVLVDRGCGRDVLIPGHVLVADPTRPFGSLASFGTGLLSRLQCWCIGSAAILKHVTLVDTPSTLVGQYDHGRVLDWFAQRADRIILLFDSHTLDIGDDRFRAAIESLSGQHHKLRIVLNKADSLDHHQLQRAYGALMWSLGRLLSTSPPAPCRVYLGSFWPEPWRPVPHRALLQADERDLLADIAALPSTAALLKLDELVKRARLAQVHAHIISALHRETPWIPWFRKRKQRQLIAELPRVYAAVQCQCSSIAPCDLPDLEVMRQRLQRQDFGRFQALDQRLLDQLDRALADLTRMVMDFHWPDPPLSPPPPPSIPPIRTLIEPS